MLSVWVKYSRKTSIKNHPCIFICSHRKTKMMTNLKKIAKFCKEKCTYSYLYSLLYSPRLKTFVFIFISATILVLFADSAFARAGGGGGFSGGGGGGGGGFSGGSSSGGGGSLFFLIYLCMRYPIIGIPVLIIIIFATYHGSKNAKSGYMTRTIRRGYANQTQSNLANNLATIQSRDEKFSIENFIYRIKNGFIKIQSAWAAQNLISVRHIMSDGVYEKFSIQLDIQKNSKIINKMENMNILDANIVAAESDHFFNTIHVMITATASDSYVNSKNGKLVYGSTSPEPFTEYWSFLRRPGTKTLTKDGLIEGRCPNCGTPLELGDSVICPSCDAIINSGEYDWVLAEITQPSEWKIKPTENIIGIKQIIAKDPSFNIQHIEDKTSVIFYRNIASAFFADKKYISKLALEEFTDKHKDEYASDKHDKHSFYADAAIGAVEVIEIIPATDNNNQDKIRVKVKWAGHPEHAQIPSLIPPAFEQNRIYTQEYILVRNGNVKTSEKNILSSTHCPKCGAPETITTSDSCEYCGALLNDGTRDWVLADITFFAGYPQHQSNYEVLQHEYSKTASNPLGKFDNTSILACSAAVMLVDGNISEKERSLLQTMADNRGITSDKLDIIIATITEHGLHIPNPKSRDEAHEFLKCMVNMCLADGKITSKEKQLITQLVSKMGYTDIDINQMIKKEKTELYKTAKQLNNSK